MRHRVTGVMRPYPMVVAILVTLASVPMLAVVLAGSATLTPTAQPRSPVVADVPHGPVVVPGPGRSTTWRVAPSPAAPSQTPTSSPAPTSEPTPGSTPDGTQHEVPASEDQVTVRPRSNRRDESAQAAGSGSGSAPAPPPSAPSPPGAGPGAGAPPRASPAPRRGGVAGLIDLVGDLLGQAGRLLGGR
jgi:hypothetical protein